MSKFSTNREKQKKKVTEKRETLRKTQKIIIVPHEFLSRKYLKISPFLIMIHTARANLDMVQNKSSINQTKIEVLGFGFRIGLYYLYATIVKVLYSSLMYSILEYNSIIWSPSSADHIQSLEAIQNRFLRLISYKCVSSRLTHS
ncbi:Uncharacterized protein FWK35_00010588 [Aphis craccivora]|uniref:Uncharacterized protein n=1 Tax=Aphis craccivora TaxID=307492 RepID=A0A6G0YVA8_APHCR|nr:Uncharacterized protein FWK35_00010588 [Aphis craccivora]